MAAARTLPFGVAASWLVIGACQAALGLDDYEISSGPAEVETPPNEDSPPDDTSDGGVLPAPRDPASNPASTDSELVDPPPIDTPPPSGPSDTAGIADAGPLAPDDPAPPDNPAPPDDPNGAPALGAACAPAGALACNGPSQKLQLVCSEGFWDELGACAVGQNCDRREGACAPIVDECAARGEGDRFCRGDALMRCGPDLVSAPLLDACRTRCAGSDGGAECRASLAAGSLHTCALTDEGTLHCWGAGSYGQLGRGIVDAIGDNESGAILDAINGGVAAPTVQITAGGYHTCALFAGGSVRCWGQNAYGQLGYPDASFGATQTLAELPDVELGGRAVDIGAGGSHSCALLDDGSVRCWGDNRFAQLGQGNLELAGGPALPTSLAPVELGGRVVQLSVGELHSCALLEDASVRCWGVNVDGQLGIGSDQNVGDRVPARLAPVDVGGPVRQISAGEHHTCALLDAGVVRCWGTTDGGLLGTDAFGGIGDDEPPSSGDAVPLAEPAVRIVAGNLHSCALLASGALSCWGSGTFGALGLGTTDVVRSDGSVPLPVLPISYRALDVVAGYFHTCALFEDARVRCWGSADSGQLGSGSTTSQADAGLASSVFLGGNVSL